MEHIQQTVKDLGQGLPPGGSKRGVCPFCFAGHEKSFVVRLDAQDPWKFWYQCYRAACGARGRWSDAEGLRLSTTAPSPTTGADPYRDEVGIPAEVSERLSKYQCSHRALVRAGARYLPFSDEVLLPIHNILSGTRTHVGWQARAVGDKIIRTSYFVEPHWQFAAFNPVGAMNGPILVVENPLSAIRLVEGTRYKRCAVALLGHILTPRTAIKLQQTWQFYQLLLDPDTWPSGTTHVLRAFEGVGCRAEARYISKKPYALSDEEIREIVK